MKKTIFSALFIALFSIYVIAERSTTTAEVTTLIPDQSPAATIVTAVTPAPIATIPKRFDDENEYEEEDDENEGRKTAPTPVKTTPAQVPAPIPSPIVPTQSPSPAPVPTPTPALPAPKKYKDGTFTGNSADAYYGYIQVQVTTKDDKIADIAFLDYPRDRHESVQINSRALPRLKSEALAAQSANVDMVSGATDTSGAFIESLTSALAQAKA